ncbi:hypothetical protein [Lysinibacter cavernae]|uniref:Uncharacterized protein n=1 Tax=Lysinibacter cavernae TaxID=1640652 RepID=A0A7X5R2J3_9MICO|nr:hypothetical protein [Lysinibacter cavernae]NIH54242.1 hypothetical protein [Lysinibacter cavernae]
MSTRLLHRLSCAVLLVLLGAGCSSALTNNEPKPSDQDAKLTKDVSVVAARDANVAGVTGDVDCWAPSEHPISDNPDQFRVLCRVHYTQLDDDNQEAQRYRDMICVGGFTAEPAVESCYQWVPYSNTPSFEDEHENSSW